MTTINFAALGFTGPSFFAEAGPAQKLVIPILDNGNLITATIINGVVLGAESNLSAVDPEVYATANGEDPTLFANIEITFDRPVSNFSVTVFNGLTTSASYSIRDVGPETFTSVDLGSNTSSDSSGQLTAGGGTEFLIIADSANGNGVTGTWDFSIDNINFDFSPAQIQTPKNPAVSIANINLVKSLLLLSELGALLSPSDLSTALFTLQFKGLWGRQFSIDALVDPFDPNYKQSYVPTFVQTPAIVPDKTVTQQAANDANTASSDFSKAVAYLQAVEVTLNRLSSATQAGDQASVALQNADLDTFLSLSSSSLAAAAKDLNALANDMMGVSLPSVTTQQINDFLNNIKLHGFSGLPQQEQDLANLFGLSSTDKQNVVNELLSANPSDVPSTLVSALQQEATALQGVASVYGGTSPEADTTIPAVAVEGSMYNAVGSAAEIAKLVTQFLPAQVANAILNNFNPQVYASEALGLVFAFGDENGGTAFAANFGPANAAMPATAAGDAAFAAAAASAIFGSAATANTPGAIQTFVTNWEAFYTSHGLPGVAHATAAQIDLAARGAAWGDAVGVELANNLGPLSGLVTNFLKDAVQGTAIYSASLASQPHAAAAQGAASASLAEAASQVQLTGVAAHVDHVVM